MRTLPIKSLHSWIPTLGWALLGWLVAGALIEPVVAQTSSTLRSLPETPNQHLSTNEILNQIDAYTMGNSSLPYGMTADPMAQVTSVSQFPDVQPTDWAYQALRSLVEQYGCVAGYPNGTFLGDRSLSRYEFAAALNACLDRITERIATAGVNLANRDDLTTLQRLQEEFLAELATLRNRTDELEVRTAALEGQQFSTTTKLFGQAIIGVQGRSNNTINLAGFRFEDTNTNINLISNVQLSLFTQFSPRSILQVGLVTGNGDVGNPVLTNDVRLSYDSDTNGTVQLSDLTYRHLIGDNLALVAGVEGVNMVNVFRGANRIESAGRGPISRFAQRNPILNIGNGRAGVGFDWQIGDSLSLQGVYSVSQPASPGGGGLFGARDNETVLGAQFNWAPIETIDIALNYVNAYSPFGRLGTAVGDDQVALSQSADLRSPINTNAVGGTISWSVSPQFTVGGWAGFTTSTLTGLSGSVETLNWMAFLNFLDLFGRGNVGGIYVGQPPKIIGSSLPAGRNIPDFVSNGGAGDPGGQPGTTTHVEAFYRWQVTDNISITPGVVVVFTPRHNPANSDTIVIGAVRTTFNF